MRKFLKYIKSRIYNSIRYIVYRLTENNNELEMNPLVQRYFLNEKDISISLFPPKDYKIMMWSYDCFGWYINIVGKGCDVYYDAENHELIDVAKTDWNNKHFTYIMKNIDKWLDQKSTLSHEENNTNRIVVEKIYKKIKNIKSEKLC